MDLSTSTTKDIGQLGEKVVVEYLRRHGLAIIASNVRTKFGELDIIARSSDCLHIVEVKSLKCFEFPTGAGDVYDPSENLHSQKIQKVGRMAAWYVSRFGWEEEYQIDGALVWLRKRDGMARIRYYSQIL